MKTISLFSLIFWFSANVLLAQVQGVAINTDNTQADPTAILDVKSTDRGALFPRMTQAQRTAISLPATGLLVFQTDNKEGFYYFDGTVWTQIASQNSSAPAGTIMAFGGDFTSVPSGWLACNGASYSQATYPDLYNAIKKNWGGNATNFNVPNLQGRFLRGLDGGTGTDPDAGSRTQSAAGGNAGNNVGSVQGDAYTVHNHTVTLSGSTNNDGAHIHTLAGQNSDGIGPGTTNPDMVVGNADGNNLFTDTRVLTNNSNHSHGVSLSGATNNQGTSGESRPKNAYVLYIIKF